MHQAKVGGEPTFAENHSANHAGYKLGSSLVNFWNYKGLTKFNKTRTHCSKIASENFSLLYIQDGSTEIAQRGKSAVLQAGDCFLLNLAEPVSMLQNDKLLFRALQLPAGLLRNLVPSPEDAAGALFSQQSEWAKLLASAMQRLTPETLNCPPLSQHVRFENICELLSLSADPPRQFTRSYKTLMLHRFRQSLRERFYEQDFCPADLAKEHRVSTRTVHSVFAAAESSFGRELLTLRLNRARSMLEDSRFDFKTVAEISVIVGFSHPGHFTTRFHEAYGVTPTCFRTRRA